MQRPRRRSSLAHDQQQRDDYHHQPASLSLSSSSSRRSAAALPLPPPPPVLPPDPPQPSTGSSDDTSSVAPYGSPLQRKPLRRPTPPARITIPSFLLSSRSAAADTSKSRRFVSDSVRPLPPKRLSLATESSPRQVDRSARSLSLDTSSCSPALQQAALSQQDIHSSRLPAQQSQPPIDRPSTKYSTSVHAGRTHDHVREDSLGGTETKDIGTRTPSPPHTPKPMNSARPNPSMTLEVDGVQRSISNETVSPDSLSKSPSRIGAFFGWKGSSPQQKPLGVEASPTTTYSDRSLSPLPSPGLVKPQKPLPLVPGGSTAGGRARLTPPGIDIAKANSSEARFFHSPETPILLGSAEMNAHVQELERELALVSAELAGSIRREMDLEDELERLKMDNSVAPSEISRRGSDYFSDSGAGSVRYPISDPDAKIQEEERLRRKAEQDRAQIKLDMAQKTQSELSRRRDLEELVQSLEDQLERQSAGGSEKTTKRVEELEAQLEENRRRLNQEKEARANFEDLYTALQSELSSGRRQFGGNRGFGSIAEEGDGRAGLSRSGSLARSGSMRAGSLNRSGSIKGRQRSGSNSTPVTAEGLQEVEDQRDALHKALKLLISRYDKQQKDHARHIKKLTRDRGANRLTGSFTGRSHYHREVSVLKEEVTTLRKRTEDALEQKWQYEKSLGGIKMDLDRAEHETRGLRDLLQAHDILAPSPRTMQSATFGDNPAVPAKPMLSAAENDRDQARRLTAQFRKQAASLQKSGGNPAAIDELQQAATRMEQLYQQFDSQVKTNTALHNRLSAAVEKGEREQEQSTRQIQDMQKKLAGMEDSLLAAQQHSENTLNKHETQVRSIDEATSPRLQRFTLEVNEPAKLSPMSPSPMRRSTLGGLNKKKVQDATLLDASRTQMLERQVRELERMLRDAEDDMQHVVQRVNRSQIEVAELTTERDAAFMQMRKLQDKLVQETERAESLLGPAGRSQRAYDSGSDYGD